MNAKSVLSQPLAQKKQLDSINTRISLLREVAAISSPILDGMPHPLSSGDSPVASTACAIADLETQLQDLQQVYASSLQATTGIILQLENPLAQEICIRRYLQGASWKAISIDLSYSRSTIMRIHKEALRSVQQMLDTS